MSSIASPGVIVGLVGVYALFAKLVHRSLTVRHKTLEYYQPRIKQVERDAIEPGFFDALEQGLLRIARNRARLSLDWEPEGLAGTFGTYIRVDRELLVHVRQYRQIGQLEGMLKETLRTQRWYLPVALSLAGLVLSAATAPVVADHNLLEASAEVRSLYVAGVALCLTALLFIEAATARIKKCMNELIERL